MEEEDVRTGEGRVVVCHAMEEEVDLRTAGASERVKEIGRAHV